MVSMPKVNPGDAVFWHCDVIHSVEKEHTGSGDSVGKRRHFVLADLAILELTLVLNNKVMYIPAVPLTPYNQAYIERQKASFLSGERPPDYPRGKGESTFVGVATVNDVVGMVGKRAMGLQEG